MNRRAGRGIGIGAAWQLLEHCDNRASAGFLPTLVGRPPTVDRRALTFDLGFTLLPLRLASLSYWKRLQRRGSDWSRLFIGFARGNSNTRSLGPSATVGFRSTRITCLGTK